MQGKVIIITGTSSGLGKAMAEFAAKKKMKIVLVDINLPPSQELARYINQDGGKAIAIKVDLSRPKEREQIIDLSLKKFGRIDYLINNAGFVYFTKSEDLELDEAHHLFEVNFWAYVDLAIKVTPIMKKQGEGIIINISSMGGISGKAIPKMAIYKASKHAIVGFFISMASELKDYNIGIKVMCPAGIRTNILKNAIGPEKKTILNTMMQARDTYESPEDLAEDIFNKLNQKKVIILPTKAAKNTNGKIKNFVSTYLNIKYRHNYQTRCILPQKILIGSHHKTGTYWLASIFHAICKEYSLCFFHGKQADLPATYAVFMENHSKFNFAALDKHFRGLHIIRDPRDVIISACFYHQKSREKWLQIPQRLFQGLTYQERLGRCKNLDEQIHFEMEHSSIDTIKDMIRWNYTLDSFFEVKYENLIIDIDLTLFHRIFIFLGFPASVLPRLRKIAYDNSLSAVQLKKGNHIRSGEPGQWRKYFKESHRNRFLELFGDALILLGYEKDNSWVKK